MVLAGRTGVWVLLLRSAIPVTNSKGTAPPAPRAPRRTKADWFLALPVLRSTALDTEHGARLHLYVELQNGERHTIPFPISPSGQPRGGVPQRARPDMTPPPGCRQDHFLAPAPPPRTPSRCGPCPSAAERAMVCVGERSEPERLVEVAVVPPASTPRGERGWRCCRHEAFVEDLHAL